MGLPAEPWPVPLEEFERLAAAVQAIVGAARPVEPGTELGPLRGKARGTFGDFAWVNPWTPLLRESVWLTLRDAGVLVTGMRAELDFGRVVHEPLIELESLPTAMLAIAGADVPEKCGFCGRSSVSMPDDLAVAASSLDLSIPLQRIAELPTVLVANDAFARFIRDRNLRDVIVTPIEVR